MFKTNNWIMSINIAAVNQFLTKKAKLLVKDITLQFQLKKIPRNINVNIHDLYDLLRDTPKFYHITENACLSQNFNNILSSKDNHMRKSSLLTIFFFVHAFYHIYSDNQWIYSRRLGFKNDLKVRFKFMFVFFFFF